MSRELFGFKVRDIISLHYWTNRKCSMPLGFSPTAFQKLAHPDGEIASSRAASKAGLPMTLSTYSNSSLEDVIAAGSSEHTPYIMQLSVMKSRDANLDILRRAERESAICPDILRVLMSRGRLQSRLGYG
jgi:isopentenyl diphosphate isomerase/L-lactate dehydrogenase-like FMN-dependent dehydrogenase